MMKSFCTRENGRSTSKSSKFGISIGWSSEGTSKDGDQ